MNNNKTNQPEAAEARKVLVAKDYLVIAILLVVMVFLWIGFGVYKILTKTEMPDPILGLAKPLKLEFPQKVFEDLSQRQNFRDKDLSETDRVILSPP